MSFADFFRKKNSGNIAKDRLKLVLVSDRANFSPEVMELIKNDIIHVISKYMEIDAEGLLVLDRFFGASNHQNPKNGKRNNIEHQSEIIISKLILFQHK